MKEEQYSALVIDVADYVLHQHCLDVHTSSTSLAACTDFVVACLLVELATAISHVLLMV